MSDEKKNWWQGLFGDSPSPLNQGIAGPNADENIRKLYESLINNNIPPSPIYGPGALAPYKPTPPTPQPLSNIGQLDKLKSTVAISKLAEALPFRVLRQIERVTFGPQGVEDMAYEVVFKSGQIVRFTDIDKFPSEADVARVCLEAP